MSHYHIYGLGAALVDTEIEVSDQDLTQCGVEKGLMTLVDEDRQHQLMEQLSGHLVASKRACGGSGANTIIAANYFGAKSFYSCRVADDETGRFFTDNLQQAGVDFPNSICADDGISGKCLVMITPDAERSMNTFLGASSTVSCQQLDHDAIKQSQWVYIEGYLVSSPTGKAASIELREVASAAGVKTALSLSDPAMVEFFHDGLLEMIGEKVDLLFCNEAEAIHFTGTTSVSEAAQALRKYANSFAITLGAKGAFIWDGEKEFTVPAQQVKAIDSNGAGDLFAGAFLFGLSQGWDYKRSGELAGRSASTLVAQYGPRLRHEQYAELLSQV
ncbi:adenosine kinase [Pseudoteredinibacter isoporae]|uniref:adenosine kinase n=1 Tax=Pseudoteredinibacter isoporae TaxID=570281 RepID=UPI003108B74A